MRTATLVVGSMLIGCGGGGGSPHDAAVLDAAVPDAAMPDAAVPDAAVPDAAVPDAAVPDAGPDAAPPCTSCGAGYVFDSLTVPLTADQALALGFDLDGDGTVDNQLGNVLAALSSAAFVTDLQEANTRAVDRGEILLLGAFADCLPDLCLFTYHGADPEPAPCLDAGDTVCRRHLQGDGLFSLTPPLDQSVPGTLTGGSYLGGPGGVAIELSLGGPTPIALELTLARASLTGASALGASDGKLGGAIPDAAVQDEIVPSIHALVAAVIAADCTGGAPPGCGCQRGSTGETLLGIFDDNGDCAVPLEELRDNSLMVTLLRPDVDTDGDGEDDALSAGFGVTAVAATFRP